MQVIRILFIDDCEEDVFLAEHQLSKAGLKVIAYSVATAPELARALEAFKPELVLSDMSLPGFSGLQALEIVKQVNPRLPFSFLCGSPERYAKQAQERGALAVLDKEHLEQLPEHVSELLRIAPP